MRLPLRARLTIAYALLLALVIAAVGGFLLVRLRADLTADIDRTLRSGAAQVARGYGEDGPSEVPDTAATVLSGERPAAQLVDADGRVVVAWGDPVARRPLLGAIERAPFVLSRDGFRIAAAPTRDGHVVVTAESLAGVDRSVRRVLVLLLIAGPVALLASALGGWWLAGRALRPVERMRARAAAIGPEALGERLAVPDTRDELARLAATLNDMLERIQRGAEEQRRLVADASHELRTPLAAMRSELDVSLLADDLSQDARTVLLSAREEVDRMSRTVDDLLTLAAGDEGRLELLWAPLDLGDVAAGAAGALAALADARGVRVLVDGDGAPARGDPERLRHALRNLLENAIEFSPPGGEVEVVTWRRDGEVGVTVGDEGPGIAPELRERVFDRFFRADPARERATGGSGLGLAIARELVLAHGGRIWAEPRAGGRGSAFSLALPARPAYLHRATRTPSSAVPPPL